MTEKDYLQGAKDFRKAAIRIIRNQTLFKDGKENPCYVNKSAMEGLLNSIPLKYPIPREKDFVREMFVALLDETFKDNPELAKKLSDIALNKHKQ